MSTPLLTTKLCIPPTRPNLVSRPHLLRRLDGAVQQGHRLTLISAPAGFGKTTLLAEWALRGDSSTPRLRIAWLSLDEGDNDPTRLVAYLIGALQRVGGSLGTRAWSALQSPQPPPVQELLPALLNDIAAFLDSSATDSGWTEQSLVLVLDDYQLITAQAIHDVLAFMLDHLPDRMHLVIATRADPPLPTARLRGRGQLTELRQIDLRFTPDEAAVFLNRAMGLDLTPREITALDARTEGWIAGLQMAAIALQARQTRTAEPLPGRPAGNAEAFIRSFTGSNRYILDYLMEEVLQHQPESIQSFLLQTSILERLTGSLCDAVIGDREQEELAFSLQSHTPFHGSQAPWIDLSSPSQQALARLEAANLFIVPLDDERRWYRYHRLWRDLLRRRLPQKVGQVDLASLHRRASRWYERQGLTAQAIDHALSAEESQRAADLIEQVAEATLMRSEVTTFLGWVERLPDEVVRTRPVLCLLHAWALLLGGRALDTVRARLEEAVHLEGTDGGTGLAPGQAAPLRAFIAAFQGRAPRAAEWSHRALEQLPSENLFLRSIATWSLGISYMLGGDVAAAGQVLEKAAAVSQRAGNIMIAVMALCILAELHTAQTELAKAKGLYQQALDLAHDGQGHPLPIAGMALIGLGELSREWNDLEAAACYLEEGIEQIARWGEMGAIDGYLSLARVRQAQGDADGAHAAMDRARQIALQTDVTQIDDLMVDIHQAHLWLAQGYVEAARRCAEQAQLSPDGTSSLETEAHSLSLTSSDVPLDYHARKHQLLLWARILIAQDQPDEALALLDPMMARIDQLGWQHSRRGIELQILRSLALQAQGDVKAALQALEGALSLAEPAGYVRIFLDEGQPMAQLLRRAASQGITPRYASELYAAFDRPPSTDSDQAPPRSLTQPLIEPLTARELEVLSLLATHLSSTEIARELTISPNTVRSHVKSIYGKLGSHSRTEAVVRAKALGLL